MGVRTEVVNNFGNASSFPETRSYACKLDICLSIVPFLNQQTRNKSNFFVMLKNETLGRKTSEFSAIS